MDTDMPVRRVVTSMLLRIGATPPKDFPGNLLLILSIISDKCRRRQGERGTCHEENSEYERLAAAGRGETRLELLNPSTNLLLSDPSQTTSLSSLAVAFQSQLMDIPQCLRAQQPCSRWKGRLDQSNSSSLGQAARF